MSTSKFAQYLAEESKRTLLGDHIKFVKGDFLMGKDKVQISPDKRFVAVVDTVSVGHVKWFDNKQVDARMGLVADGFRSVHRNQLGDLDTETWEVDDYGNRKDPWQKTTAIVLIAANKPHEIFTFSTTTEGGQGAVRDLCEAHMRATEGEGQYPVVTPGSGLYQHKNRAFGRVIVPVFEIVDCVEAGPFNAMVAGQRGGASFLPASRPVLAIADGSNAGNDNGAWNDNGAPPVHGEPDGPGKFDDPIPF